jgi:hypothetical protein
VSDVAVAGHPPVAIDFARLRAARIRRHQTVIRHECPVCGLAVPNRLTRCIGGVMIGSVPSLAHDPARPVTVTYRRAETEPNGPDTASPAGPPAPSRGQRVWVGVDRSPHAPGVVVRRVDGGWEVAYQAPPGEIRLGMLSDTQLADMHHGARAA